MPLVPSPPEVAQEQAHEQGLHHQLTVGQMTMVAVGGSIGTGLLLGSAAALEIAGPSVIVSYVVAAFIAYTVAMALGELASMHPAAGSFAIYGELYLNQYLGFLCRAAYWASIEFWFSMIKFATIVAFILAGAALMFSGHVTPQYNAHGGFLPKGPIAPLLAIFLAIYAFGGVEMLAVTTGESRSSQDIPRAARLTFFLLAGLYLGAIIVLVGVMPWNHVGVTESPFVSVLRLTKIPAAAFFMNFVVLTAALSGANAKLYVASRLLFSMGRTRWAPRSLGKLNASGSPRLALLVSSYGIVTAVIIENWAPKQAFLYIMGAAFSGLILSWIVSLAAHVSFRWRLTRAQVAALPMRSPLGVWGSVLGFVLVSAAVLHTLLASRVNEIGGLTFLVILTVAYIFLKRSRQAS